MKTKGLIPAYHLNKIEKFLIKCHEEGVPTNGLTAFLARQDIPYKSNAHFIKKTCIRLGIWEERDGKLRVNRSIKREDYKFHARNLIKGLRSEFREYYQLRKGGNKLKKSKVLTSHKPKNRVKTEEEIFEFFKKLSRKRITNTTQIMTLYRNRKLPYKNYPKMVIKAMQFAGILSVDDEGNFIKFHRDSRDDLWQIRVHNFLEKLQSYAFEMRLENKKKNRSEKQEEKRPENQSKLSNEIVDKHYRSKVPRNITSSSRKCHQFLSLLSRLVSPVDKVDITTAIRENRLPYYMHTSGIVLPALEKLGFIVPIHNGSQYIISCDESVDASIKLRDAIHDQAHYRRSQKIKRELENLDKEREAKKDSEAPATEQSTDNTATDNTDNKRRDIMRSLLLHGHEMFGMRMSSVPPEADKAIKTCEKIRHKAQELKNLINELNDDEYYRLEMNQKSEIEITMKDFTRKTIRLPFGSKIEFYRRVKTRKL